MENAENITQNLEPSTDKENLVVEETKLLANVESTDPSVLEAEEKLENKSSDKKEKSTTIDSVQKARCTRAINEFKTEAQEIIKKATESQSRIFELSKEVEEVKKKSDDAFKDIEEKSNTINTKNTELLQLHKEIFESTEEKESIESSIKKSEEEIKKSTETIQAKKKDLDEYYIKIFGSKNEGENEVIGLKQEIEKNKSELASLYKQEEEKFNALFKKIEGLLPGATSTGLAKAFADQKNDYRVPNILWSLLFIATMIAMAVFGVFTLKDITGSGEINFSLALSKILARTPFFIAVIWLGYFSSKQQSQNKRLEQEYAHKENVSRSYEGFKKQINDLEQTEENKELSLRLLGNVVDSVGLNPSNTLDNDSHREEPPLLDKALSFFTGSKKGNNNNSENSTKLTE